MFSFGLTHNMDLIRPKALFLAAVFLASPVVFGVPFTADVTETGANFFDHCQCEEPSTRRFDFTVTWAQNAPDGVERNMFMVNGQFPGPKLELVQGDSVVVKLRNSSPFNTTIHYHGAYPDPIAHHDGRRFC